MVYPRYKCIRAFFVANQILHQKSALYMRHSSPNRPNSDPHYFWFFSTLLRCRVSQKNTIHEVLDFFKNGFGSISPKITRKIENDTDERYRLGWNFDSKFYVTKKTFLAMGKSGRGFGLEVMRKSKLKKIKKKPIKHVKRDSHIASLPISQSFFSWESMLLDFGFLTEEASWMNQNF